ncbi:endospore germination permease [Halalkalibacter akibai]|uniref:Uncharacterized protein n=1 Tax=Halalkalibacter akibai (strain ATCC 43226 / DSM 21942 / CIP 109018 / JCM 9157 / 1139) TaxID=1236973 RepID=W4QZ42_HALA3|nr:endospore germination permease [Halalkalibacter akibai]GAE37182.1 hypothetical protein JCM9157_4439 [Halalkalibacter akibai JCM 9157]
MQSIIKILIPRQLFLLVILSTGLLNHVILIPNLLEASGRDSWIAVILSFPLSLFFAWVIYLIVKNCPLEGFFSYVEKRVGRIFAFTLSIPVIVYLFIASYVTFRDLIIWLSAYFLADAPLLIINIILLSVCFIVTLIGLKSMAIASGLILPIVMILGIFIALTNTTLKDPSLLFPLFADGSLPVWKGVMYSLAGILEIYVVVLLQPFSQKPIKFYQLVLLVLILYILTLGPLTAAIMEFGPTEATNFRYPAYEQWRVLQIGDYISHLDFLALYQWLSGAIIRIALFLYLLANFFTSKKKHYRVSVRAVAIIYFALLGLVLINVETFFFYRFIHNYFLPGCMIFFATQILLSAIILFVLRKRDEKQNENAKKQPSI